MALVTQSPPSSQQKHAARRLWNAPTSRARGFWLVIALLLVSASAGVYLYALKTQLFPGPFSEPLRDLGIVAFLMVLGTAAYALRRRFARNLPGKVQNWLWMHVWLGITALLVVVMHENFARLLNNYCQNASCLTEAYGGTSALFALLLLVLTGLLGRGLDYWQARVMASEASTNGAGIIQASEEQLLALEQVLERLCAGKSEAFKRYCLLALATPNTSNVLPHIPQSEHKDFQAARDTLRKYSQLARSLKRQKRARLIMRNWRIVHALLAILALSLIIFHASMELLTTVFHIIQP